MEGAMKKAAKEQEKSDLWYLEMEEKRLEFGKLMLEMENQRWIEERDREEQCHRKEREFQLKICWHCYI